MKIVGSKICSIVTEPNKNVNISYNLTGNGTNFIITISGTSTDYRIDTAVDSSDNLYIQGLQNLTILCETDNTTTKNFLSEIIANKITQIGVSRYTGDISIINNDFCIPSNYGSTSDGYNPFDYYK